MRAYRPPKSREVAISFRPEITDPGVVGRTGSSDIAVLVKDELFVHRLAADRAPHTVHC